MEEPVGAVPRDRHGLHPGPDRGSPLAQRWVAARQAHELGEVVAHQPVAGQRRLVPLKHDDAPRHARHLEQAGHRVAPVVVGEHGHGGVERAVTEGQRLGLRGDARRRAGRPLRPHDGRGLDGDHVAVRRLVGPGARADVHDGARLAERRPDARRDARLGAPRTSVIDADLVVQRTAHRRCGFVVVPIRVVAFVVTHVIRGQRRTRQAGCGGRRTRSVHAVDEPMDDGHGGCVLVRGDA